MKSPAKFMHFHSIKCIWKCGLRNGVILSRPQCVKGLHMTVSLHYISLPVTFLPLSPPGWRGIVVTGRAGGCQTCGTHISVTAWWIFSIRSSVELSRPVVVHRHGHLPICPKWACPWPKTCQIWYKLGPDFAERISLKPLDGLTPFKVSWTCLDL